MRRATAASMQARSGAVRNEGDAAFGGVDFGADFAGAVAARAATGNAADAPAAFSQARREIPLIVDAPPVSLSSAHQRNPCRAAFSRADAARARGGSRYFRKPFPSEHYTAKLRTCLDT